MSEEDKIITGAVDALTGKPLFKLRVPIKWQPPIKRSFLDRILSKRKPIQEKYRQLEIWPCVVANQYRIAGECAKLPKEIFEAGPQLITLIPEHQKRIVYIVAAAIQNNHLEPDEELLLFIERNLDGLDLFRALIASNQQLNLEAFSNSIVLMQDAVSIIKTSPMDGSE